MAHPPGDFLRLLDEMSGPIGRIKLRRSRCRLALRIGFGKQTAAQYFSLSQIGTLGDGDAGGVLLQRCNERNHFKTLRLTLSRF